MKHKGKRRAADFPCRRWQCPACKARHVNQHLSWLYRCIVRWSDPLRLLPAVPRLTAADVKAGTPPGDYPPPERPAGPWELRMTLADPKRLRSLQTTFRRWNRLGRRVEYVAIKVTRLFNLAGSRFAFVNNRNTPPLLLTNSQHGTAERHLLIVAFHPDLTPPKGLPRVSVDFALMFIAEHLACAGEGVKVGRLQPVSTSDGWKPSKTAAEHPWDMEGTRAHALEAVRRILDQLGARPIIGEDGSCTWRDTEIGEEVSARFADLCREQSLTADEIVTLLSPPTP